MPELVAYLCIPKATGQDPRTKIMQASVSCFVTADAELIPSTMHVITAVTLDATENPEPEPADDSQVSIPGTDPAPPPSDGEETPPSA